MATKIKHLKDEEGKFYPYTHIDAVVDSDGTKVLEKVTQLDQKVGELNSNIGDRVTDDGKNYIILDKDKTFEEQVTHPNTIYDIRYDFGNIGADNSYFNIPDNCVLLFNGGSIASSCLTLNRTTFDGVPVLTGNKYKGTFTNAEVHIHWFTNGMSSNRDYSVDHSAHLKEAIDFASLDKKWLNCDKIGLCIKQTIVFGSDNNLGIKGANIYFISSEDKQSLFEYNSERIWAGNYSPIIDSTFTYVGNGSGVYHADVCCLRKKVWYDTYFTYWRDIQANGFTGYFLLNHTYIQECTFENVTINSGCGFISYNSEDFYDGGKGSSNILHFLNISHNNGRRDANTSYKYIVDLHKCMEVTFVNTVLQGAATGNVSALHIGGGTTESEDRAVVKLDGFWVEYPGGNVKSEIVIDSHGDFYFYKNCINEITVTNPSVKANLHCYHTNIDKIKFNLPDENRNVRIYFDSTSKGYSSASNHSLAEAIKSGTIVGYKDRGNSWREASYPVSHDFDFSIDLKEKFITELKETSYWGRSETFLKNVNGITCINIENTRTSGWYDRPLLGPFGSAVCGKTYNGMFVEHYIYRVTVLVDVTSENVEEVYCRDNYIANAPGGMNLPLIDIQEGMQAGYTTGWKEVYKEYGLSDSQYGFNSQQVIEIRNCRLEIAKAVLYPTNATYTDDIRITNDGESIEQKVPNVKIYKLSSVSADNDNKEYIKTLITDSKDIFVTNNGVYKNDEGNVLNSLFEDKVGDLNGLTTENKADIVSALNELKNTAGAQGPKGDKGDPGESADIAAAEAATNAANSAANSTNLARESILNTLSTIANSSDSISEALSAKVASNTLDIETNKALLNELSILMTQVKEYDIPVEPCALGDYKDGYFYFIKKSDNKLYKIKEGATDIEVVCDKLGFLSIYEHTFNGPIKTAGYAMLFVDNTHILTQSGYGSIGLYDLENSAWVWNNTTSAMYGWRVIRVGKVFCAVSDGGIRSLNMADGSIISTVYNDYDYMHPQCIAGEYYFIGPNSKKVYKINQDTGEIAQYATAPSVNCIGFLPEDISPNASLYVLRKGISQPEIAIMQWNKSEFVDNANVVEQTVQSFGFTNFPPLRRQFIKVSNNSYYMGNITLTFETSLVGSWGLSGLGVCATRENGYALDGDKWILIYDHDAGVLRMRKKLYYI